MIKKDMLKTNKGITLIALVITIVILVILAGVSMSIILGDDGLLNKATHSKKVTDIAQEKEGISIAFASGKLNNQGYSENVTKEDFDNLLKNQFGINTNITTTDNKDGSFTVTFDDTDRVYYIESNGNIIEKDNMIKISTAEELKAFRDDVNSGNTYEGKYIFLANNITLDISEQWQPIGLYLMTNSSPEDETNLPFKGIFNGNGNEVNGIYINTTDKVQGLFGLVDNGKIMNVIIGENNNIIGGNATAGLVGYLYNGGIITECYNKSNVNCKFGAGIVGCAFTNTQILNCGNSAVITGKEYGVGGIAGMNKNGSKIKKSYNTGKISGKVGITGGITGLNSTNSIIEETYNLGEVEGSDAIGGIVGSSEDNSIVKKSYNSGNITGNNIIGGIVGRNSKSAIINECYNEGEVESTTIDNSINSNVGGILGFNDGSLGNGIVMNCYNKGSVKGNTYNIGGIIGLNRGNLKNSYNTAIIENYGNNVGGIVGNNSRYIYNSQDLIGIISNSYCLESDSINIYGINTGNISEECSEKTSENLKKIVTTLGSSFKEDKNNINNGYPILSWQ